LIMEIDHPHSSSFHTSAAWRINTAASATVMGRVQHSK
jgi:hypothetical protein